MLRFMGLQRVGHDRVTELNRYIFQIIFHIGYDMILNIFPMLYSNPY